LEIHPDEFRQQFIELSDEGLLSIERNDLIEMARMYFDAEVARRGLHYVPPTPTEENLDEEELVPNPDGEGLVPVATFPSFEEANLGRALVRSADIPAYLENELTSTWIGAGEAIDPYKVMARGLRLMVPTSFLEQAKGILEERISDENLLAQAEAAEPVEPVPGEDRLNTWSLFNFLRTPWKELFGFKSDRSNS
jgi:hypothetical protein